MSPNKINFLKVGFSFALIALFFFGYGMRAENIKIELKRVHLPFIIHAPNHEVGIKTAALLAEDEDNEAATDTPLRDSIRVDSSIRNDNQKEKRSRTQYDPAKDTATYKERVLLIGDSQLEKLRLPFFNLCETNGSKLLATVIWYGSTTTQWANSDTLAYFIKTYRPTVVLFAIGLNELFVVNIEERKADMRRIIALFEREKVKYCWLGPAAWTKDKGIVEGMRQVVGRQFYDASKLVITRDTDGHHPSKEGGIIWADSVAYFATRQLNIDFSRPITEMKKLRNTRTILISN
jgi:hypothetical protein